MKRLQSTAVSGLSLLLLLLLWQVSNSPVLPSPFSVFWAYGRVLTEIGIDTAATLFEAFGGMLIGVALALAVVVVIDLSILARQMLSPIVVTSQAVPFNVIAPIMVLIFGYGLLPKIAVVSLVCFFPMTLNLLGAFDSTPRDLLDVARLFGAGKRQTIRLLKLPLAMPSFFAGLKIGAVYSISGAVIAEWLAGDVGLGVYIIRAKRSYAFDRVFAVVILITVISILLYYAIDRIEKRVSEANGS